MRKSTNVGRFDHFRFQISSLAIILALPLAAGQAVRVNAAGRQELGVSAGQTAKLAAGLYHSLKVDADGQVWAWGANTYGQLGDGTLFQRTTPVRVSGLTGVKCVAAGDDFSLALKDDGTVWAWGNNNVGQLGDGTLAQRNTPIRVSALIDVVMLAARGGQTVALKSDGTVWRWGWDSILFQLSGGILRRVVPEQVNGFTNGIAIGLGYAHIIVAKSDGTVWTMGANDAGQLGDQTNTFRTAPVAVFGLTHVTSVKAGPGHSLALKSDGTVWSCGNNFEGNLGNGTATASNQPVQVTELTGATAITAGDQYSIALRNDGTLRAWGLNQAGQLGDGTRKSRSTPVVVPGIAGVVVEVVCGTVHVLAATSNGDLWAWGADTYGAFGNGTSGVHTEPTALTSLGSVSASSAGATHSLAVKSDGTVWAWGANWEGQLGDGTTTDRNSPIQALGLTNVTAVSAGDRHGLALKKDGTVWAWGANYDGNLGDGTYARRPIPIQVATQMISVGAGAYHSAAVKFDQSVWTWGANDSGQLGDGTTTARALPVKVAGLTAVKKVACGNKFCVAMKNDGTVWTWGDNSAGQLGRPGPSQSTPVAVDALSDVVSISAGWAHALALKSDGTVWTWGDNGAGQLGDGTNDSRSGPLPVTGLTGVAEVAAGYGHSMVIKNDGTLWIWGRNQEGQFGNGTTTGSAVPVQITGITSVSRLAAGFEHSMILKSDGTLWIWGDGRLGQLGDGTTRPTGPVQSWPVTTYQHGLNRSRLSFTAVAGATLAVTSPQDIVLTQTDSGGGWWSASTNQPWLQLSRSSGTGSSTIAVSILSSALPGLGVFTGNVTITSPNATNGNLTLPVSLQVTTNGAAPIGLFETPVDNIKGVTGSIALTGWALDDVGVKQVTIWRDPVGPEPVHANGHVYIGEALFVPGARPDVESKYSTVPAAYRAGWGYMLLTNTLPAGGNSTMTFYAIAVDEDGHQSVLGKKIITTDNLHAVKPFGAIDTPSPGEAVSGVVSNQGWALTPMPANIATNGSTIWVNVDGVDLGHPVYGAARGDIQSIFPGYANASTAGGSYSLNTAVLTNGMHTISWNVYDSLGRADGMGSRYFYVQNATLAAGKAATEAEQTLALRSTRVRRAGRPAPAYPAFRRGHDLGAALTPIRQGGDGILEPITLNELDRIEIHLPAGQQWTASLRGGSEARPLPIGSTFDAEAGIFYWQLGPAFLGEFPLEFRSGDTVLTVPVHIAPTRPIL